MRPPVLLLTALTACAASAPAQVLPGRALGVIRGVAQGGLIAFEPLLGTRTPLDTTALATLRLSIAVAEGDGLILGGGGQASTDDVLLRAAVTGNRLHAPTPYVQGLRGRAIALFPAANNADLLVVTNAGLFAAPATGGVARALTPSVADMRNTGAALPDRTLLVTTGFDSNAAPGLWLVDLIAHAVRFVPLRLSPPLAVATGPTAGTLLIGDGAGRIWTYDLASQAQNPFANLGNGPVQALVANPDQRDWVAASPGALHVFRNATSIVTYPVPAAIGAIAYRPYESSVALRGIGCRGSSAQPPVLGALGRPTPGNSSFVLTLARGPAGAVAILMIGGDRIDVGLDPFGLRGCRLYTTPLVTLGVSTGATGGAQYPLPVPPNPDLVGGGLQTQWLVHDPGANPASFTTTNAGSIEF